MGIAVRRGIVDAILLGNGGCPALAKVARRYFGMVGVGA